MASMQCSAERNHHQRSRHQQQGRCCRLQVNAKCRPSSNTFCLFQWSLTQAASSTVLVWMSGNSAWNDGLHSLTFAIFHVFIERTVIFCTYISTLCCNCVNGCAHCIMWVWCTRAGSGEQFCSLAYRCMRTVCNSCAPRRLQHTKDNRNLINY